jgi:SWIM zinc finger
MATGGLTYRYGGSSGVNERGRLVGLSTFTPDAEVANPTFFRGFVERADVVAAGLLAVAGNAASRYFEPFASIARRIALADPVVTSDGERLRFESFSLCCGVHARLDLDPAMLSGEFVGRGTTNVDVSPPLREALARVGARDPIGLTVGRDDLMVATLDGTLLEKKVPLPRRWVKGFGETQVVQSRLRRRIVLDGIETRRLIAGLPVQARQALWIEQAGRSARIGTRPSPATVSLWGPDRIGALRPLLRFAKSLTIYGFGDSDRAAATAWELDVGDARLTLTVSAEPRRGFSGEGQLLGSLISDDAVEIASDVDEFAASATWTTPAVVGTSVGVAPDVARDALDVLAASGRVGFDLAQCAHFHRPLPLGADALQCLNPRRAASEQLVAAGAVTFAADGRRAVVRSSDHQQVVTLAGDTVTGATCTCQWWAKHRGERGPCKHVLATVTLRLNTGAAHKAR